MAFLILARHGNTFEADQTPTWVGARTDMPLTAKGEEQGGRVASMVVRDFLPIDEIVTGPLQRTKKFAELLSQETNTPYKFDDRLCEIDYGQWENISTEETRARFGDAIVDGWEKDGTWPEGMGWSPDKETLQNNIASLLAEQYKALIEENSQNHVLFTSNGILRFVYKSLTGKPPSPEAKVKPGNYCVLEACEDGWRIVKWNEKPA